VTRKRQREEKEKEKDVKMEPPDLASAPRPRSRKKGALLFLRLLLASFAVFAIIAITPCRAVLGSRIRDRRWIALSGYSHYRNQQKQQLLPLRGGMVMGRMAQFSGSQGGNNDHPAGHSLHHLESRVAEVFSKVAFSGKANASNEANGNKTTPQTLSKLTSAKPELMEIVPTTERVVRTSTATRPSTTRVKATTMLPETTPKTVKERRPKPPGSKKNRNNSKQETRKELDQTLQKLDVQSKQILFGSTTPRSLVTETKALEKMAKNEVIVKQKNNTIGEPASAESKPAPAPAPVVKVQNISAKIVASPEQNVTEPKANVTLEDVQAGGENTTRTTNVFFRGASSWDAHVYVFFALFALLALGGVVCVGKLASSQQTALSKGYNLAIILFVVTLATAQSVALFAEFYQGGNVVSISAICFSSAVSGLMMRMHICFRKILPTYRIASINCFFALSHLHRKFPILHFCIAIFC
jgi:hypothetical protein